MELLEPKFQRPGKPGHVWPGVFKLPPSHPDKKNRWRLACPAPLCFFQGSYADEGMARKMQETHPCPWFCGGTTTLSWGIMSDMFLAPIWEKLDEAVDELMRIKQFATHESLDLEEAKGKARGMAEALAVLMPPFFHTGDEIVREAMVRHQKRKAGEEYETPGIGRLRYALPPGAKEMTPSGIPHAVVAGTKHSPEYHPADAIQDFGGLDDGKVAEIVKQLESGFQPRMLAVVHSVDEKVIGRIARAHGKKV